MQEHLSHTDAVAIKKSGVEGWEPYKYERVGDDLVLTGSVPRILTRGPRKGKRKWEGKGTSVVVTRAEVDAQSARYIAETGNCPECYGEGEVFSSWHKDEGVTKKQCPDCKGSRRAAPLGATEHA
jgi:hypothetical protein